MRGLVCHTRRRNGPRFASAPLGNCSRSPASTSDGRRYLGDTLLGRAGIGPQEVRRLQEDPSGLLDRPAEELVALYRNFWVIEPALPDDLQAEYVRLLGPTPVDVWAVTGG